SCLGCGALGDLLRCLLADPPDLQGDVRPAIEPCRRRLAVQQGGEGLLYLRLAGQVARALGRRVLGLVHGSLLASRMTTGAGGKPPRVWGGGRTGRSSPSPPAAPPAAGGGGWRRARASGARAQPESRSGRSTSSAAAGRRRKTGMTVISLL